LPKALADAWRPIKTRKNQERYKTRIVELKMEKDTKNMIYGVMIPLLVGFLIFFTWDDWPSIILAIAIYFLGMFRARMIYHKNVKEKWRIWNKLDQVYDYVGYIGDIRNTHNNFPKGVIIMGLKEQLNDKRQYIVVGAMIVGVLMIWDILPKTVEFFGLDDNIKFVYTGLIALGLYTFHTFYWSESSLNIQRTVNPRRLSDPRHMRDIAHQRGERHVQRRPMPPPQQAPPSPQNSRPPRRIWDDFEKEWLRNGKHSRHGSDMSKRTGVVIKD
jgi:hypothetical protein